MAQTLFGGSQVRDGSIGRSDLNVTIAGESVIRKIIAGTNVTISSTGVDEGTGDVTINATGGGGGGSPGGTDGELQYKSGTTFAGAANVEIHGSDLRLVDNAAPTTPDAGVKLFSKNLANRSMAAIVGPSGMDAILQPSIWRQKVSIWNPPGGGTVVPGVFGFPAPTALGTATTRALATTNLLTRTRRLGYVSAATAAAFAGWFGASAGWTTGNGAGLGGFFAAFRFAFSDAAAVAGARAFAGFSSSAATPTNVEPSTITNCFGLAQLSTDSTQLFLVYGGSAAQTAIALGTNFPPMQGVGAVNGVLYDITVFCPPSANGIVHWRVERVGTAFVASGTLTPTVVGTQTPASTTLLAPRIWRGNNATAAAVGVDILGFYAETDY